MMLRVKRKKNMQKITFLRNEKFMEFLRVEQVSHEIDKNTVGEKIVVIPVMNAEEAFTLGVRYSDWKNKTTSNEIQ